MESWFKAGATIARDTIRDGLNYLFFVCSLIFLSWMIAFPLCVFYFGNLGVFERCFGEHGYHHFMRLPTICTGKYWDLLEVCLLATAAVTVPGIISGIVQIQRLGREEYFHGILIHNMGVAGLAHRDGLVIAVGSVRLVEYGAGPFLLVGFFYGAFMGYLYPHATSHSTLLRYALNVLYGGLILSALIPPFLALPSVPSAFRHLDDFVTLVFVGLGVPVACLVALFCLPFWFFNTSILGAGMGRWIGSWWGRGRGSRWVFRQFGVFEALELTGGVSYAQLKAEALSHGTDDGSSENEAEAPVSTPTPSPPENTFLPRL